MSAGEICHLWLRFECTCSYTSRLAHIAVLLERFDCTTLLNVARYVTDFGKSLDCSND